VPGLRRSLDAASPMAWLERSPLPALLLDAAFLVVDANPALVELCGRSRESLIGLDPIALQPAQDRPGRAAERAAAVRAAAGGGVLAPQHQRLLDAEGRARWFAWILQPAPLPSVVGRGRWLVLLQDLGAEYAEREQARRAQDELAQWFELARTGMLVYDPTGLIVRSNAAFEALAGRVPEVLDEAMPELQSLLGWGPGGPNPALAPGGPMLERQALVPLADGRRRRLVARLVCCADDAGGWRVLAVLDDRSAEDERDLAQLEMGMLMDTASVGVATFDAARGWLAPGGRYDALPAEPADAGAGPGAPGSPGGPGAAAASGASGMLRSIGRDVVEPASLPDYERLQRALREGVRAEVRYAVRDPELGLRWLLTRVEPASLAGGRSTTSVVTLDVTERERAQQRHGQLLRELTTILDSSHAGIAYLRGPLLVRCNRRFERMLGLGPGAAAGATLAEILAPQNVKAGRVEEAMAALAAGHAFEWELPLWAHPGGELRWAALSVQRAEPGAPSVRVNESLEAEEAVEAVAVLTDVTRLKAQQAELEQLLRDRELMFNLSEVGIFYQRGNRIERANQAMATLAGYAVPELTALDPAELYVDAREFVDFEMRVAQGLRESGRFVGERRLRRRDGSLLWVQVSARRAADPEPSEPPEPPESPGPSGADAPAPAHADGARQPGVICSFVDVDERHRARETLALQAERTRAVLNSVLVGIVTVSARGIEWMNRSARRMFAGELADFVGESIAIVATPEPEHPLRRTDWMERLREGESEIFECRLRGRDGREFWVVGNAVRSGGDGLGPQLTFALLDIERRRQAEIEIAQAQASLQRVIETAPLAIALLDARTLRVLQVNQNAGVFFGRPSERLLGATPQDCFDAERAERLAGWLEAARRAGQVALHEWHDRPHAAVGAAAGAEADRTWDCRIAPLAGPGGEEEQLLLVASDVTGQRVAEQARLQAAIDQREVLVREVHHRIKNNLQGVAGLLRQTAARQPEVAAALTEAVGQVQAIAQVYGLQVGSGGPLGLAGLVEAIASSVQRTFGHPIVVGTAALPHCLPEGEAIPIALTLNELLTNAIKHGEGAPVRCTLRRADEVEDEGAASPGGAERADGPPGKEGSRGVCIEITNRARLAAGFDLAQVRGGVSGLGLVRALLPRRGASLAIGQRGDEVVASIWLRPPSVRVDG
jgi:PAS domain S-box-containing protein